MTIMEIKNLDASNVVVVVVIGKEGVTIVVFSNFCYHTAWYDVVSNSCKGDLGNKFFHEACIGFVGKNCQCFSFNSVDVAMFNGADVNVDLREFRDGGIIGGLLEEVLLLKV